MSQAHESSGQPARSLTDLFARYLRRQMTAEAEGLGFADLDGQATPYEAAPVQPVDPRLAWRDGLAVVPHFPASQTELRWEVPPDWPVLVAAQEPAFSLAFCIGNFPQMVRNLHPLLSGGDLVDLRPATGRPATAPPPLLQWAAATRDYPHVLLAAGVLRLLRRFEEAGALLKSKDAMWQALRANEEAALTWHRGRADEALALWQAQKASVPVLFNRGMAALFLGRPAEARPALREAVAQLPDTSTWHHLGHLYLALAGIKKN
ncbi:MAG TPA: hypothetical protein VH575_06025 [Gemmataceae bacterium]|jgi:tetratricopeptide (TPR) repeat protein